MIFLRSKTNYVHVRVCVKGFSKKGFTILFLSRIVITASCAVAMKHDRQTLYYRWTILTCQRRCLREYCYRMFIMILLHTYFDQHFLFKKKCKKVSHVFGLARVSLFLIFGCGDSGPNQNSITDEISQESAGQAANCALKS